MNLIDTYVSEVGRRLPQKTRADIEAEIRSALQDLLDERSRAAGKSIDDEMTLAVLKEYGDPEKVAASYHGERYLIGPRLYPTFEKVVFAVLPITIILALVGMGFSLSSLGVTADEVLKIVITAIGNLIFSVIVTIGSITFIFAILERTVPEFRTNTKKPKEWDPRSLLKIAPPDRVRVGSLIADLFFTALALLLFNSAPARNLLNIGYQTYGGYWIGFISNNSDVAWSMSLLTPTFFRLLLALEALWGIYILFLIVLLSLGHWDTWSRWVYVGVKTLEIALAIAILVGDSFYTTTITSLTAAGFPDPTKGAALASLFTSSFRGAVGVAIFFASLDIVRQLFRLFRLQGPVRTT
jgi:hypothetical protein